MPVTVQSALIAEIYAAALDKSRWDRALAVMAECVAGSNRSVRVFGKMAASRQVKLTLLMRRLQ